MKSVCTLNVGIYAGNLALGGSGGTAVYKRALVEALERYASLHRYTVILDEYASLKEAKNHVCYVNLQPPPRIIVIMQNLLRMFFPRYHKKLADCIRRKRLQCCCRKYGIDLLHFPVTVIPPEFQNSGYPAVLTFFDMQHEFYPEYFEPEKLDVLRAVYRSSVSSAEHILASSAFTRGTLEDKYNVARDKIAVLPVGVEDCFERLSDDEAAMIRERYQIKADYVIYPANPWPHKNHELLLRVFSRVLQQYAGELQLVLTGKLKDSTYDPMETAQKLGIAEKISDLGFVPAADMPGLYSGARMLVFPSKFEGFGIPVLEAMACGCPVLVSNESSLPEVGGDAVFYIDPDDETAMVNGMLRILQDRELAEELANKGIVRSQQFTWEKIVPKLEACYSAVWQSDGDQ